MLGYGLLAGSNCRPRLCGADCSACRGCALALVCRIAATVGAVLAKAPVESAAVPNTRAASGDRYISIRRCSLRSLSGLLAC